MLIKRQKRDKQRLKNQRLLVVARLDGPSWWRAYDMRDTYWHWDGERSWHTSQNLNWKLYHSRFTPKEMLAMGNDYYLVNDPRRKKQ